MHKQIIVPQRRVWHPGLKARRPRIKGYRALDDGSFRRDWSFPPSTLVPKRWAAVTLSGGPGAHGSGLGQNSAFDLTNVDAGDSIVVAALWSSATITMDSVDISGESDATLLTARGPSDPDNTRSRMGYLSEVTSGGTKSITINLSATVSGAGEAFAIAFDGGDTTGFFDAENFASGTGATATLSLTTGVANACIVAISNNNNANPTQGSGYTNIALADNHWFIGAEYLLGAGAAGAKTVDMSNGATADWTINAASFKPAAAAGDGEQALSGSASTTAQTTPAVGTTVSLKQVLRRKFFLPLMPRMVS